MSDGKGWLIGDGKKTVQGKATIAVWAPKSFSKEMGPMNLMNKQSFQLERWSEKAHELQSFKLRTQKFRSQCNAISLGISQLAGSRRAQEEIHELLTIFLNICNNAVISLLEMCNGALGIRSPPRYISSE